MKAYIHLKIYTHISIAALSVTLKSWKQSKNPSVCEWSSIVWCIHTMAYYLAMKRIELFMNTTTCMKQNHFAE
jgi:beta-lactamase class D